MHFLTEQNFKLQSYMCDQEKERKRSKKKKIQEDYFYYKKKSWIKIQVLFS